MKKLSEYSWNISEEDYRKDPALSYSTLAKFEREGFNGLPHLFDKLETPSLTFGSAVDTLITDSETAFNERFIVCDLPPVPDTIIKIVKDIFNVYGGSVSSFDDVKDEVIYNVLNKYQYQLNWRPETRVKVVREKGSRYYELLSISDGKTILDSDTYTKVVAAVRTLRESNATKKYFADNNPFDDSIERFYQLKWKASLRDDIEYRCMMDLAIVNHKNKTIRPIDLKTSGHNEWDFQHSFIQWNYQIQARLYYRLLEACLDDTEYEGYDILNYKFIVINGNNLRPLVWEFPDTMAEGTLKYGKNRDIICRDPFDIGYELNTYLKGKYTVPYNIKETEPNDLRKFLNEL
jgi:hypothetical protein